jgi:hypothetical protein
MPSTFIPQGVTTDHGIVMMSAREGALASQSTFLVAVTRIADKALIAAANWNAGCCAIRREDGGS